MPTSARFCWMICSTSSTLAEVELSRSQFHRKAVGVAGLGQQRLGPLGVIGQPALVVGAVADQPFGVDPVHQVAVAAVHRIQDGLAVNGHLDGLAHARTSPSGSMFSFSAR